MPSDMGSRKLGSGRYRGLDEESHMPGFQNPTHGPTCGPNSMKPSIFGVSNSVNNQFKKRTHHVVSTTWHLVFLPFHTKKTCIDGCLSSHSCRKTRRSDDSDPSLFFWRLSPHNFLGASGCFRLDGTHNLPCLGRSDFASRSKTRSWCSLATCRDAA